MQLEKVSTAHILDIVTHTDILKLKGMEKLSLSKIKIIAIY